MTQTESEVRFPLRPIQWNNRLKNRNQNAKSTPNCPTPSVRRRRAEAAVQKAARRRALAMKVQRMQIDGRGVVSGDEGDFDLDGGSIIGRPIQRKRPMKRALCA